MVISHDAGLPNIILKTPLITLLLLCKDLITVGLSKKSITYYYILKWHIELQSRAAPSVEAHHHVHGPDPGRNSGGRGTEKALFLYWACLSCIHAEWIIWWQSNVSKRKKTLPNFVAFSQIGTKMEKTAELIENTNSGNIFCCLFGLNLNIDFNPMTNKYLIYSWLWRLACCVFRPVFWCSTHTKAGRNTFFFFFFFFLWTSHSGK